MPKSSKKVVSVTHQPYKLIKSGRVSKPLRSSFFSKTLNLFLRNLKPRKKGSPTKSMKEGYIIGKKRDEEEIVEKQVVTSNNQKTVNNTDSVVTQPAVDENKTQKVQVVDDGKKKIEMSNLRKPRHAIPLPSYGSRSLYMMNLSPHVQESDVLAFFKDVGKVEEVEFTLKGCGHVRFDTYDASHKALELSGEELIDRPVELMFSEERSIWDLIIPNDKYTYLFMGNLSPSIQETDVINFFKDDGKVEFVRFITKCGYFLGYGHVKFGSFEEALKAVQRDGAELLGRDVELVLASESSVWHEYTPNSKKPPGFGVRRGPGYGPTKRGVDRSLML